MARKVCSESHQVETLQDSLEADEIASALLARRGIFSMTGFSDKKCIYSTADCSTACWVRQEATLNLM